MQFKDTSTECSYCHKPLLWVNQTVRWRDEGEVYEFEFRCDSCKREYRFTDGKLRELKFERDPVTEHMAMRKAEIDSARNLRCPNCGGSLDDWLTCDWCHERYSVENGELIPRIEEPMKPRLEMSYFYALQRKQ